MSREIQLTRDHIYYIAAVMTNSDGRDHLSVGQRLPSGRMDRPIANKYLIRYAPGGWVDDWRNKQTKNTGFDQQRLVWCFFSPVRFGVQLTCELFVRADWGIVWNQCLFLLIIHRSYKVHARSRLYDFGMLFHLEVLYPLIWWFTLYTAEHLPALKLRLTDAESVCFERGHIFYQKKFLSCFEHFIGQYSPLGN